MAGSFVCPEPSFTVCQAELRGHRALSSGLSGGSCRIQQDELETEKKLGRGERRREEWGIGRETERERDRHTER